MSFSKRNITIKGRHLRKKKTYRLVVVNMTLFGRQMLNYKISLENISTGTLLKNDFSSLKTGGEFLGRVKVAYVLSEKNMDLVSSILLLRRLSSHLKLLMQSNDLYSSDG